AEIIYWEPVCSPETLERARAAMAARSIDRVSPSRRHWLRGVAVCGQCGRPLEQNARNGRRNRERGWDTQTVLRCVGTRAKPCSGGLVADAKLPESAESEFLAAAGRLEAVESVYVPGSDVEGDLAAVERAITNLRDDRDAGLFDDDEDDYRDRMGALVSRRRALREVPTSEPRWERRPLGFTVAELWERSTPNARGRLISDMGLQIRVYSANRRRNIETRDRAELVPVHGDD